MIFDKSFICEGGQGVFWELGIGPKKLGILKIKVGNWELQSNWEVGIAKQLCSDDF